MLKFLPAHSHGVVFVAVLAAATLAPFVDSMIRAESGPPTSHRFVPTGAELPATDAEPAPTF